MRCVLGLPCPRAGDSPRADGTRDGAYCFEGNLECSVACRECSGRPRDAKLSRVKWTTRDTRCSARGCHAPIQGVPYADDVVGYQQRLIAMSQFGNNFGTEQAYFAPLRGNRAWTFGNLQSAALKIFVYGHSFAYAAAMKSSHLKLLGLVAVGALLGACADTTVGSDTVRTQGIWASLEVKATGSNARLVAKLNVGGRGGTVIYPLIAPDDLRVSVAGGEETSLSQTCPESNSFCSSGLGDVAGRLVRVNFFRASDEEDAPDSRVTVPRAFSASVRNEEVVRGNDILLNLSGAADDLQYSVEGDCIFSRSGEVTNSRIPASAIRTTSRGEDDNCQVTVTLTSTAQGSVDSNFGKGGKFVATQERKVSFLSRVSAAVVPDGGDTSTADTTTGDTSSSSGVDSGVPDSGIPDSGVSDSDVPDSDVPDSGIPDSGTGSDDSTSSNVSTSSGEVSASSDDADAGLDAGVAR